MCTAYIVETSEDCVLVSNSTMRRPHNLSDNEASGLSQIVEYLNELKVHVEKAPRMFDWRSAEKLNSYTSVYHERNPLLPATIYSITRTTQSSQTDA